MASSRGSAVKSSASAATGFKWKSKFVAVVVFSLLALHTKATMESKRDLAVTASSSIPKDSKGAQWTSKLVVVEVDADGGVEQVVTEKADRIKKFLDSVLLDAAIVDIKIIGKYLDFADLSTLVGTAGAVAGVFAGGIAIGVAGGTAGAAIIGGGHGHLAGTGIAAAAAVADGIGFHAATVAAAAAKALYSSTFHHDLLVFSCLKPDGQKFFFTLEKNGDAIYLQAAMNEKPVTENLYDGHVNMSPRNGLFDVPLETDKCRSDWSLNKVIDWMFAEDEHQRMYNLLFDNCQHFAERLFNHLAVTKKYPSDAKTTKAILTSLMTDVDNDGGDENKGKEKGKKEKIKKQGKEKGKKEL